MDSEVIVGLLSSLMGGALVAIITYLSSREKNKAEAKKLEAEAEKIRAETTRLNLEIGLTEKKNIYSLELPEGWIESGEHNNEYDMGLDSNVARSGRASGFIKSRNYTRGFATMMQSFKATNYLGKRLRLSAYLRVQDVEIRAWLWMRVDGPNKEKSLSFDNMFNRPIKGTVDWRRYEVVLDVPENSENIAFGFALVGNGQVWADGFEFGIVDDSVPTTDVNKFKRELPNQPTNLNFDL
ncbi:MAG TPA: hypothetical protein VGD99_26670 [Anaerolineae bacterium]|jgi:hypothetical protein